MREQRGKMQAAWCACARCLPMRLKSMPCSCPMMGHILTQMGGAMAHAHSRHSPASPQLCVALQAGQRLQHPKQRCRGVCVPIRITAPALACMRACVGLREADSPTEAWGRARAAVPVVCVLLVWSMISVSLPVVPVAWWTAPQRPTCTQHARMKSKKGSWRNRTADLLQLAGPT